MILEQNLSLDITKHHQHVISIYHLLHLHHHHHHHYHHHHHHNTTQHNTVLEPAIIILKLILIFAFTFITIIIISTACAILATLVILKDQRLQDGGERAQGQKLVKVCMLNILLLCLSHCIAFLCSSLIAYHCLYF